MWVRLDDWLIGDHFVTLAPTGSVMEVGVHAFAQKVRSASSSEDGVETLAGRHPTTTGMSSYRLTGVVGPPQWTPDHPTEASDMFVLDVGGPTLLVTVRGDLPASISAGSRVTVECRLEVLDGYDHGQLDTGYEPTMSWRVVDQFRTDRQHGFGGHFLDLEPP